MCCFRAGGSGWSTGCPYTDGPPQVHEHPLLTASRPLLESHSRVMAVHSLHAEPGQIPARHRHPGRSPSATRATVVTCDDGLMASVTPLRRQHIHLRARREMPGPDAHVQAALTLGGSSRRGRGPPA